LFGNLGTSQAADELLALAAEHAATDYFDPAMAGYAVGWSFHAAQGSTARGERKRPRHKPGAFDLVEAAGIEPASEDASTEDSTCVSSYLISRNIAPRGRLYVSPVPKVSPIAPGRELTASQK
jgi:hypothetical protein